MNIVVISLKRAVERRKKMIDQLGKLPTFSWSILNAIDGGGLSGKELEKRIHLPGGYRYGEKMLPGEIACTMSHSLAITLAKENKWPYVLILEDDAVLADDFEKRIKHLLRILPPGWEHVYLSTNPHGGLFFSPQLSFMNIIESTFCDCITAYLVRDTAYDKILNYYSFFWTTADDMIAQMIKEGRLKSYTFYPYVVYSGDEFSYIWDQPIKREHPSKKFFRNEM